MPPSPFKNNTPSEHMEQVYFVSWFRKNHKGVRIFAIPNGGARNSTTGAKLKAEGVSPGVPDLYIPEWNLWIEMKRQQGGKVSPAQRDWLNYLDRIGCHTFIANGFEDAKEKTTSFVNCTLQDG